MEHYVDKNEKTFRLQFEIEFDFLGFNLEIVMMLIEIHQLSSIEFW